MKIIIFSLLLISNILASDVSHLKYDYEISSGYSYYNSNLYTSIETINNYTFCCDQIKTGSSIGRSFEILFKYSPEFYSQYEISFSYSKDFLKFSELEDEEITVNGTYYPGIFDHKLDMDLQIFQFGLGYNYNFIKAFYLGASAKFSFIENDFYNYSEEIVIPSDRGVFKETGTRSRNEISGKAGNSLAYGVQIKAYYLFPLNSNHNLYFIPEIFLGYKNFKILSDEQLSQLIYGLGINISYKFGLKEYFK